MIDGKSRKAAIGVTFVFSPLIPGTFVSSFAKNGNYDRIAVLFFLCYDERREGTGGMSALLDDDR